MMTYEQLSSPDQSKDAQHITDTTDAYRVRKIKSILAEHDREDILIATALLTQLPRPVRSGEYVEWESDDDRIHRELGRLGGLELGD